MVGPSGAPDGVCLGKFCNVSGVIPEVITHGSLDPVDPQTRRKRLIGLLPVEQQPIGVGINIFALLVADAPTNEIVIGTRLN